MPIFPTASSSPSTPPAPDPPAPAASSLSPSSSSSPSPPPPPPPPAHARGGERRASRAARLRARVGWDRDVRGSANAEEVWDSDSSASDDFVAVPHVPRARVLETVRPDRPERGMRERARAQRREVALKARKAWARTEVEVRDAEEVWDGESSDSDGVEEDHCGKKVGERNEGEASVRKGGKLARLVPKVPKMHREGRGKGIVNVDRKRGERGGGGGVGLNLSVECGALTSRDSMTAMAGSLDGPSKIWAAAGGTAAGGIAAGGIAAGGIAAGGIAAGGTAAGGNAAGGTAAQNVSPTSKSAWDAAVQAEPLPANGEKVGHIQGARESDGDESPLATLVVAASAPPAPHVLPYGPGYHRTKSFVLGLTACAAALDLGYDALESVFEPLFGVDEFRNVGRFRDDRTGALLVECDHSLIVAWYGDEESVGTRESGGSGADRGDAFPPLRSMSRDHRVQPVLLACAANIQADLFEDLESLLAVRRRQVLFTGYGIGGAHALLSAMTFEVHRNRRDEVSAIYTFGQPPTVNNVLAKYVQLHYVNNYKYYRYSHANDEIPGGLQASPSFVHIGHNAHIVIRRSGEMRVLHAPRKSSLMMEKVKHGAKVGEVGGLQAYWGFLWGERGRGTELWSAARSRSRSKKA